MKQITLDLSNVRAKTIDSLIDYCRAVGVSIHTDPKEPNNLHIKNNKRMAVMFIYFLLNSNANFSVTVGNPHIFEAISYHYPNLNTLNKRKALKMLPQRYVTLLKLSGDV